MMWEGNTVTIDMNEDMNIQPRGPEASEGKSRAKKKFLKPGLIRHESLPEVTTSYVGTFDPEKQYPPLP